MNTQLRLLSKDCCKVAELRALYQHSSDVRQVQQGCISLLQLLDAEHIWRSIWILRLSHFDHALREDDLARIVHSIDEPSHWIARLCVCQLFALTGCPESLRCDFFPYLAHSFSDRRSIVRAWAISALWTFRDDPNYQSEITSMLEAARRDSAKSVQARLRHL